VILISPAPAAPGLDEVLVSQPPIHRSGVGRLASLL
jgi:hypothetical protein